MRSFIAFFIRKPIWANAIIVLTMMFGFAAMFNMDRSFFPETQPRRIYVNVFYPGASPVEMEEGVTIRVEEAIKSLDGIEEIISKSRENVANITVIAYEGTDLDELLQEIKNTIDGISSFPAGAEKPIIFKQKSSGMNSVAAFMSLTGPDDLFKLKEVAERIERDFLASSAISQVQIFGYPPPEISIEIREQDLLRYNLRFADISNAVKINNIDISAGSLKTKDDEILIRSRNKHTDPEKIGEIIIRTTPDGQQIRIRDVAEIKYQFEDTPNKSYLNGQRSVSFIVNKLPNEDLGQISNFITAYTKSFNKNYENYQLRINFQFSELLDERIDLLVNNGVLGLILVLFVLGLFLSLRLSGWVAFGIPFSFLGMFALGAWYGMTINMISLFGMIVVVGILVDDAIVVAENIYSHFERGKSSHQAALDGTMEVLPSVFASVLTTIVAFATLLFVGGDLAQMKEMAFAVIACLIFSLIESFLVLPSHLASKKVLGHNPYAWYRNLRRRIENGIASVRDYYGWLIQGLLRYHRSMFFMPLVFIIIVIVLSATGIIRFTFFPNIPFDDIKLELAFKPGEVAKQTENELRDFESKIWALNDSIYRAKGDSIIKYMTLSVGNTESIAESGPHCGMLRISINIEGSGISSQQLAGMIRSKVGVPVGLEKLVIGGEARFGKPVSIALSGLNYEKLKLAKDALKKELTRLPDLKDITDNSGTGNRELHIKLKSNARLLGLSQVDILTQLRQGFFGEEAQRLIIGQDEVKIWVRYPQSDRKSISQLEDVRIKTPSNQFFPLSELIEYEIVRGEVGINHYNGNREINIDADLENPEEALAVTTKIEKEILSVFKDRFPDVKITFRGQAQRGRESGGKLAVMFVIAQLMIILILTMNFRSILQALLIFIVIPVGIFGAFLGHGVEHIPVSVFSFWGIIALIGILVNDSVVMLDTYNRFLREGMPVRKAVYESAVQRFRPILLTTLTTVVGLYPLILEKSFQAQFLVPMAVAVAYGVLFGTLFVMFFFPVAILAFNDILRILFTLWDGKKQLIKPEEAEPALRQLEKDKEIEMDI
ncbi:MAG: efflux RND transporter permease subunit [Flavobacteriales bacterium]